MENKYRGVPIEIDGQPLFLRFDFNAVCALEKETGQSYPLPTFIGIRALIWAGLLHDKTQACTLQEVGDMLTPYLKDSKRYLEINEAALAAYKSMFPDEPKEGDSKNALATPGAGI